MMSHCPKVTFVLLTLLCSCICQPNINSGAEMCNICSCPADITVNPYVISCQALSLNSIPQYGHLLETQETEVSNVHLMLDFNNFKTLYKIPPSTAFDYISFVDNQIESIEPLVFSDLVHLKHLSLKGNLIGSIKIHPEAFRAAPGKFLPLEILDLSDNRITHLDDGIFQDLVELVELDLSGNPIWVLDASTVMALNGLATLEVLGLARTSISDLPLKLKNPVANLESLDLSGNSFENVPEVLQYASRMITLRLDKNSKITELNAASLIGMDNLKNLNISAMKSLSIIYKGTFNPLASLDRLYCSDNPTLSKIEIYSFLDDEDNGPSYMSLIDLKNNNLTTIHEESMPRFQTLYAMGNPLICSCELSWLQFKLTHDILDITICKAPISVRGQSLSQVNFSSPGIPCGGSREASGVTLVTTVTTSSPEMYIYGIAAMLLVFLVIVIVVTLILKNLSPKQNAYTALQNQTSVVYRKQSESDISEVRYN